jgi:hypothetical protein
MKQGGKMKLSDILSKTFLAIRLHFVKLVEVTGLYIIIAIVLGAALQNFAQSSSSVLLAFVVATAQMVLAALITFVGIRHLLEPEEMPLIINKSKIFNYLIAAIFISIATTLGMMFLVIPGLIVATASILYPVYILKDGENAFNSIEKSIDAVKGNIATLCIAYCVFYVLIYGVSFLSTYALSILPVHTLLRNIFVIAISHVLNLLYIPFIVVIYNATVQVHGNQVGRDSGAVASTPHT